MADQIHQLRDQLAKFEANQLELNAQIEKIEQSMQGNNAAIREMIAANASTEQIHARSIELREALNTAMAIVKEKLGEAGFDAEDLR